MTVSDKNITLFHPTGIVKAVINLPASKSISNRLLIINRLSNNKCDIENLSDSTDTQNLKNILESNDEIADVKDAGTSMRFLTTYYCATNQTKIITGTDRICQRPIGELVSALRTIGFQIEYLKKEGFPPIKILKSDGGHSLSPSPSLPLNPLKRTSSASPLGGRGVVEVDASVSSQYISALLMIAPVLKNGLTIVLKNAPVSEPYIMMTLKLMSEFGIAYSWEKNKIIVPHQNYSPKKVTVEADWSAASYWYIVAALSKSADIRLLGLKEDGLQGDKIMAEWGRRFGVETRFDSEGATLIKNRAVVTPTRFPTSSGLSEEPLLIDFINNPDLAQSILVMAAVKNIPIELRGIESLRIKETDRIEAMRSELKKINAELIEKTNGVFLLKPNFKILDSKFETYNDHRMAMAFAPVALKGKIKINNPDVVKKSYPSFWEDLKKAGFVNISQRSAE
jgi:3-phosphoshikimate 1-carboxyvinyltransferase